MEILKLENIEKAFGENHVLNAVNLSFNIRYKVYSKVVMGPEKP